MATATQPTWDLAELPPFPVRRFTVDEYHVMIAAGVFAEDEDFELLEGWIVPKMTKYPPHEVSIELTQEAVRALLPAGWRIRTQMATTTRDSEPEPDLCVVRGTPRDHLAHHPGPDDIALVIEVADSSIGRDRGIKQRIYARAAIPIYWIVNVADRVIEVYNDPTGPGRKPTYRRREEYRGDEIVPVVIAGREVGRVAARELLP
jgi:Uma2 family endonuclease